MIPGIALLPRNLENGLISNRTAAVQQGGVLAAYSLCKKTRQCENTNLLWRIEELTCIRVEVANLGHIVTC